MDKNEFLSEVGPLTENETFINAVHDELTELAAKHGIDTTEFNKSQIENLAESIIADGTEKT